MRTKLYILSSILFSQVAFAQSDFNNAVECILLANPQYASLQNDINSQKASLKSINNLSDPEVEYGHQWGQYGVGEKWSVEVSQSFEWPGLYGARKTESKLYGNSLDRLYDYQCYKIRKEIENLIIDAVYNKKQIQLFTQISSYVDSIFDYTMRGMERGDISKLDSNKLKVEKLALNRKLNSYILDYNSCINKLNNYSNTNDCESIIAGLYDFPTYNLNTLEYYLNLNLTDNPQIKYNSSKKDVLNQTAKVVKMNNLPSFNVGYNHEYEIGEHFNGFKIGVTLPFFSNKHKRAEVLAKSYALDSEAQLEEIELRTKVISAYDSILKLNQEISEYDTLLASDDNIRLLSIALKYGQITIMNYFMDLNYYLNLRSDYIDICAQRAKAFVDITL